MKNEKDIDNLIREKLEGYSASPPPHIWDNVQRQLAAQKPRNRRIYIAWISTAAIVVLAFLAGWYFNENPKIQNIANVSKEIINPGKTTENKIQQTEIATRNLTNERIGNNSEKPGSSQTSKISGISTLAAKITFVKTRVSSSVSTPRENTKMKLLESAEARVSLTQNPNTELAQNTKIVLPKTLTGQDKLIIAENIRNSKASSKRENSWKMGMYVAPGYSSYTASHDKSYSQSMTYSGNNGNANVNGGFSVQYKTSKRWIVESGIYYAQNGKESENTVNHFARNSQADYMFTPGEVNYFSNTVWVENNKLAMNSTAGVIEFKETPVGAEFSSDFEASKTTVSNLMVPEGQFSQVFEFMEIPLYVRYRVIDSKIGVELITGLNAGIVVGNNAYINNQYGLQNIGETMDISPVNLSGTIGVGLNYELGKHFALAIEPRFNYYLNSINTNPAVEFRPYRIGFYTGLIYGF